MKETTFINQNKKKWAKFERMSKQDQSDPDELSELFVELTDDLSYARTHYSKRSVKVYLNSLAQKSFHGIYKNKREPFSKLVNFWTTGLPLEMYRARKALLASFLVFAIGMLIGIVSTMDDPDFLGAVIGYEYVDMTEENIANKRPMDVYGSGGEISSFIGIAMNNLRVSLYAFVLGVFFSFGSALYMFFNGIMVGAFQWFFKVRGLLLTSFLTIWIHGAFEIPAIILAGAAGMTMGNGLVFPKTLTRVQSLSISAKRGMKIMVGIFPIIVVAAFIEGFATRHTEWHYLLKLGIILSCFGIMLAYFVIYPFMVAKKHNFDGKMTERPSYVPSRKLVLYKIRDLGAVFTDSFVFYRKYFKYFGKIYWLLIPMTIAYLIWVFGDYTFGGTINNWYHNMRIALSIGSSTFRWESYAVLTLLLSLNVTSVYFAFSLTKKTNEHAKFKDFLVYTGKNIWRIIPLVAGMLLLIQQAHFLFLFLAIFITPFLFMLSFPGAYEEKKLFTGIGRGFSLAGKSWGTGLGTFAVFCFIMLLIFFFAIAPLQELINMFLGWFLISTMDNYHLIMNIVEASLYLIVLNLIVPFFFISFNILYFSVVEKEEAYGMFEKLKTFGKTSKIYESPEEGEF